jgi:hypothetical protein
MFDYWMYDDGGAETEEKRKLIMLPVLLPGEFPRMMFLRVAADRRERRKREADRR